MRQSEPSPAQSAGPPPPAHEEAATAALEEAVALALSVLKGVIVLLVIAFLASGFFTISSNEVGFIRRLGVQDDTPLEAGLHWRWQVVDEVLRIDKRPRTLVSDRFDLARDVEDLAGDTQRQGGLNPAKDGYLLTGDTNVVHVSLAARVAPRSPYLQSRTRFADPDAALGALLDRAALQTAAYRKVDALLGGGKAAFLEATKRELQDSLDQIEGGIAVQGVDLERDLSPSPQVREAFGQVTQASQRVDKLRSEAQGEANRISNDAIVSAAKLESDAKARADALLSDASAMKKEYDSQLAAYQRDPRTVRERLLARVLAEALQEVGEAFLVGEGELRISLERDTRRERKELQERAAERLGVGGAGAE